MQGKIFFSASAVFFAALCVHSPVFAERIVLKSGQKIEGKITEKTDEYVVVDLYGVAQPYFLSDIATIDDQPVLASSAGHGEADSTPKPPQKNTPAPQKSASGEIGKEIYTYLEKGQYNDAIRELDKYIKTNPNNSQAFAYRGLCFFKNGDLDTALGNFNAAIELDGKSMVSYTMRGLVRAKKGDYDLAISDYSKAIEINPKYAQVYYDRSVAYFRAKDYAHAKEDAAKAQELGFKVPPQYLADLEKAAKE